MKCPLKFFRYEFEGGETCIGAECGFYGCVCTDATNGTDGETNGIHDEITLSGGDAVAILRDWLDYKINRFDAEANAIILNTGADPDKLYEIADMVERDYVRRDDYDFMADALKYMKAERDELEMRVNGLVAELGDAEGTSIILERQRDEWKAKYEGQASLAGRSSSSYLRKLDECEELERERDEWKAKAEEAEAKNAELQARMDELTAELEARDKYPDGFVPHSEMMERVGELTEQLEAAHAKNRALKAHISKMQAGRHGWHVRGVELQRQVDELTAQLHASSAERALLRECLGIATDNAHDLLALVDESGNVYDRDEGLA